MSTQDDNVILCIGVITGRHQYSWSFVRWPSWPEALYSTDTRGPLVDIRGLLERPFGWHVDLISDSGVPLADIGGPLVDARVPSAEAETGGALNNTGGALKNCDDNNYLADTCCHAATRTMQETLWPI